MKSPLTQDTIDTLMFAEAALSKGFAKIVLLGTSAISALLAAVQTQALENSQQPAAQLVIAADGTMRLWCLTGSLIGALIRVSIRPPKNLAGFARSFIVSLGTGLVASPLIIRHFIGHADADYTLAVAAAASFLGWLGVEGIEKFAGKWIKSKTDGES